MTKSAKNRKWLGLFALMPAIGMVFTDQGVLPVALPTIQKNLGATTNQLWWCVNSYLLVSAVLLLAGGKIGDRIGYRKAFVWGMIVFAAASAFCGLTPSVAWLIVARGLQGIGAALMIPASSPLLMSLFPQNERGKAVGINVSVSSLFLIFSPLIGGYFTETLSWRWIFWINLPIAIVGIVLVFLHIPRSSKGEQKFDPWGFIFFLINSTSLVTLIMQASDWGWTSITTGTTFALFIISGFFLFWREKKARHPFIDLSLFRHPIYKAVNITIFATQFVMMITVYRALFFQDALGWTPLKSGTIFFITSAPILFVSPLGGWIADRFGSKVPIAIGFLLLIYSFFWLAFNVNSSLQMLLLGFFAFGIGIPLIFTPSYSSAMGSIPQNKAGTAFGVIATVRALSSSLGVAIIGAFANQIQFSSLRNLIEKNPKTNSLDHSIIESLASGSKKLFIQTTPEQLKIILNDLKISQIKSFIITHMTLGFALIIALAVVFMLYHRKTSHHLPQTPGEGWD